MADPICRWRNATPKTVCELVRKLPKEKMSSEAFRELMTKSKSIKDFFHTSYQLACQLALYVETDTYTPRFTRDITEEEALEYLKYWFSKYYVPNPYTRGFANLEKPILVEYSIYEYLKNNNNNSIELVCSAIFKEPKEHIGNIDIFINAINSFSKLVEVDKNKKCSIKKGVEKMEINNSRDDKKAFFENFNSNSDVNTIKIDKSHNRIVFGAPGTGKSNKLEKESSSFTSQEQVKEDTETVIKAKVTSAKELKNNKSIYNAIGFKYSKELDVSYKDIEKTYGKNTYEIYVGAKAAKLVPVFEAKKQKYEEDENNDYTKNIKEEINSVKSAYEQNLNAIGFVYGDFLSGFSTQQILETFALDPKESKAYWLSRGAQASTVFDNEKEKPIKFLERVTFHPNYSYPQFVGTYKPVKSKENSEEITYEYVPGPFMRVYVNAVKNTDRKFLLLIEEINRANVAAVFGDVFQLLDRKADDTSQYPITASEDQKNYLKSCGINDDEISIPANMYIWATMNSADQGVLPMDAAFKRRWDFEYIGIDDNEGEIEKIKIPVSLDGKKSVLWNDFRKKLNEKLSDELKINEDKLLGPFFLSKKSLENAMAEPERFIKLFESKVIMYLFEDVVKMQPAKLFNCSKLRYSEICKEFEEKGMDVFGIDVEVFDM